MTSSKKLQKAKPVHLKTKSVRVVSSKKLKALLKNYKPELEFILSADRERSVLILDQMLDYGVFTVDEFARKIKTEA